MSRSVRLRVVTLALAAGLSLGGQPAGATASTHHPTGLYERFADCPLAAPVLENCVFATVSGGSVTVGRRTLTIEKPIVLQGGFNEGPDEESLIFLGAEDGNTLSGPPLSITGGLTGILAPGYLPAPLQTQVNRSTTGLTIALQLAKPASAIELSTENLLSKQGTALQLPVKLKLSNQFLGDSCYIGSSTDPVVLSLTTGVTNPVAPNRPIGGATGKVVFGDGFRLIEVRGSELVDNSFAAPQATGCAGSSAPVVDAALDAAMGLPSAAGRNTAILYGTFYVALPSVVRESEQ